jgi:hypothetical protein
MAPAPYIYLQSTPDFFVAEHYGLRNTTCLYSKDIASGITPWQSALQFKLLTVAIHSTIIFFVAIRGLNTTVCHVPCHVPAILHRQFDASVIFDALLDRCKTYTRRIVY